jgi:hypothetical protein
LDIQPEHCVAWAKSKFEEYFAELPRLAQQVQTIAAGDDAADVSTRLAPWLNSLGDEQVGDGYPH